jgi:hypothetical protein
MRPGANATILSYNASDVGKTYSTTIHSLVGFGIFYLI